MKQPFHFSLRYFPEPGLATIFVDRISEEKDVLQPEAIAPGQDFPGKETVKIQNIDLYLENILASLF